VAFATQFSRTFSEAAWSARRRLSKRTVANQHNYAAGRKVTAVFILLTLTLGGIPFPSISVPSVLLLPSLPSPLVVGPIAASGSGGAYKLPQRVLAEPRRQTYFGVF